MFERVKVAAVNFVPWTWHPDWNADRLERFFREAAKRGAKLAVAPEGIIDSYSGNTDLLCEALIWPKVRRELVAIAQPIDGSWMRRFEKLAKQLKMCLVFGMAELLGRREVYNTAVFIDHRGHVCGTYRKVGNELAGRSWHFNRSGKTFRAFDTPLGRCGMLICSDRWHSAIAESLVLDGARFLCIPTAGVKSKENDQAVLARARENGVPIIQANVGSNVIISKGEIVALDRDRDTLTIAEIEIPAEISTRNARTAERGFYSAYRKKIAQRRSQPFKPSYPRSGHPPKPARPALRIRVHNC